jgi:hypothetical protein
MLWPGFTVIDKNQFCCLDGATAFQDEWSQLVDTWCPPEKETSEKDFD